jgi:hypothetical protein
MTGQGLPAPIKVDTGGTNLYGSVPNGGADKQVQMLRMLTGGKKGKKGGSTDRLLVPQFPNGGQAANATMKNLFQIAGQSQANAVYDNKTGGGRRRRKPRKTKKMKRTHKRHKKTRRRYK